MRLTDNEAGAFRPRRSVLYMPSSNERLAKAKALPVDALILDLRTQSPPTPRKLPANRLARQCVPANMVDGVDDSS